MTYKKLIVILATALLSVNIFAENYSAEIQPEKKLQELNKKCEEAREIKLKPLRNAEIKK